MQVRKLIYRNTVKNATPFDDSTLRLRTAGTPRLGVPTEVVLGWVSLPSKCWLQ